MPLPDQISQAQHMHKWDPHAWSVMQGHMCMLETYVQEGTASHAIIMEDDIHIRADVNDHLPKIMQDFHILNLDILLLGYLTPDPLHEIRAEFPVLNTCFTIQEYPFNVYGTQMYVVSRPYAEWLVSQYGVHTAWSQSILHTPDTYNADWLITKQGRRACVWPMLAVEELGGGTAYQDSGQTYFHDLCHRVSYDADIHI